VAAEDKNLVRALKRQVKAALPPFLFLALALYFGWNATRGDLGLKAYAARQHDLQNAEATKALVAADTASWERRVQSLRAGHLDPDMLEERARAMLNLADPADIVVPYGKAGPIF